MASGSREAPSPAILVIGGAFSPVHSGHLAALQAAQAHAEARLPYKVVAAYLACAHEGYTNIKYKGRVIPAGARLEMCNLAARHPPSCFALLRETPKTFGSASECGKAMVRLNHTPDTKVLIVCGADKLKRNRKPDHIYISHTNNDADDSDLVPAPEATLQLSATLVRAELGRGPLKETARRLVAEGKLPDAVGAYIAGHPDAFVLALGDSEGERSSPGSTSSAVDEVSKSLHQPTAPEPTAQAALATPDKVARTKRRRRWGKEPSASSSEPAATRDARKHEPRLLQRWEALCGVHVRVRWCPPDDEEAVCLGLACQSLSRGNVKIVTDEGDIMLVPVQDLRSVDAIVEGAGESVELTLMEHPSSPPAPRASKHASNCEGPTPMVFDMETGDPDDVLTLLLLGACPDVELRAVTCTPGSQEQVAMIRWLLAEMGLSDVRVGAQDWPQNFNDKGCMDGGFYKSLGRLPTFEADCEPADQVLLDCCDDETTLLTGAPLHNLGAALQHQGFRVGRWVAQGGFAGVGVVPRHLQMKKFAGQESCPTWNFNGNVQAARDALASPAIGRRVLVSKNVCHRAVYDEKLHAAFGAAARAAGRELKRRKAALQLLHGAMDKYLRRKPGGKKLHDPLALAVALDESVCQLAEVQVFREGGGWGSRLAEGSRTWISVDYDDNRFRSVLVREPS